MATNSVSAPLFSNSGAAFDGSLGSAVILPHEQGLELTSGAVEMVVNLDALSFRQGLFSKDSAGNDEGGHFAILAEGANLRVRLQDDANGTFEIEADGVLETGVDHHIVVTFGPRGIELWLDGVLVGTNGYTGGMVGNKEPIVLGANQWASGDEVADIVSDPLDGEIKTVVVYGEQLNEAQIGALASGEEPAEEPGLEEPANTAPIASDDTASTDVETDVTLDLLGNDSDAEGPIFIDSIGDASNGFVVDHGDGTVTYTPNAGFSGEDSFTYTIIDAGGLMATATATVTVAVPTDPEDPVDPVDPVDPTNPAAIFTTSAASFDGSTGSAVVLDHEAGMELANGAIELCVNLDALSGRQGLFTKDSSGNDDGGHVAILAEGDSLRIRLQDAANGTFEINAAGVLEIGVDHHIVVTFGARGMELWVDGALVGTESYTGGLVGNKEPIVLGANQWASGDLVADRLRDGLDGEIKFASIYDAQLTGAEIASLAGAEPPAEEPGPEDPENTAPTASDDAATTDAETAVSIDLLANDGDAEGPVSVQSIGDAGNGIVTDNGDGTVTYTPNPGFSGQDSFTYTIVDEGGLTATATATVDVAAAEDPGETEEPSEPVGPDPLFYNRGASYNGTTEAATIASHQQNLEIAEGSIEFCLDLFDFTPRMGILTKDAAGFGEGGHLGIFVEGESLTIRLQDGDTTHKIFALDVLSLNANHHVVFNFGANGMELWLDGELIRTNDYTGGLVGNKEPIVIGANQWRSSDETADVLIEPLNGAVTEVSFYGRNLTAEEIPAMGEQAKNREAQPAPAPAPEPNPEPAPNGAPEATDDLYQIDPDNTLDVAADQGLLANDLDAEGDALTATLVQGSVTEGAVTVNADGSFSFDGGPGFSGSASFEYQVTDGTETVTATATITTDAPANRPVELREIVVNEIRTDMEVGTVVGELIGFDPDNDEILYDLLSGSAFDYLDVVGDQIVIKSSVADLDGQVLSASFSATDGLTQDFGGAEFEVHTPQEVSGEAIILLTYGQSLTNSFRSFERISEDQSVADKLLEVSQGDGEAYLRQFDPGSAERTSYAIAHRIAHEYDAAGQDIPTLVSVEAPRNGASLAELVVDPSKGFASVEDGLIGTENGELFYVRNPDGSIEYYGNRNGRASGTGRDEEPQFDELLAQLERAKEALDATGAEAADTIYMNFQQGQSDDKGVVGGQEYSDVLMDFLDRLETEAARIFEKPVKIEMFLGQTRSYGGDVAYEHFKAVVEDDNIHFGATEFNYQAEFPARREIDGSVSENSNDAVHLNSIGYNLIGQQIGRNMYEHMTGEAAHTDPIYVSSAFVDGTTVTLTFANVEGQLVDDRSIWHAASRVGAPEHFGVAFIADGAEETSPLAIVSSAITGRAEVTFELAAPLTGETTIVVGSNFDENETFHGATLRDSEGFSADIYPEASLVDGEIIHEFVGRQRVTIDEDGLISTEYLGASGQAVREVLGDDAVDDVLALAGDVTVALGFSGDDRFEHQSGDSVVDGGAGTDSFVVTGEATVELVDGTLGDGGVAEISVTKGGVSTTHYLYDIEQVLLNDQAVLLSDDGGLLN